MKIIIDYMTVSRSGTYCLQELVNAVTEKIRDGWQPYGDMVIIANSTVVVCQVMVKYEPTTPCPIPPPDRHSSTPE